MLDYYLENVCWDISVEGSPGSPYPFIQSFVVVADVLVVFGDQTKKLEDEATSA